ncbi:sugar kinase [Streptomyces sp. NPDC050485]|uniref:sugar kinase n=1 Tax=Streptomyces sp. NPDC050485 TaxID=3365617 RepID=UPI0037A53AA7
MVTFLPTRPGRLADVPAFERTIGGAESNVACALAAAGHRAKWVGRVGADGFGDHLVEAIGSYGVDVSAVRRDPARPTGIYFRTADDRAAGGHEVLYYRRGSAASAMSPATVPCRELWDGRILHLSGITAALSDDCLALMRELLVRRAGPPLVSFDVNYRPGLWRDAAGAAVLLELARGADVVFVGEDEAEEAWGVRGAAAVRAALPEPEVLVVKRGAAGATVFAREEFPTPPLPAATPCGSAAGLRGLSARCGLVVLGALPPAPRSSNSPKDCVQGGPPGAGFVRPGGAGNPACDDAQYFVPSLSVDVVAPTGAGDAFAAGFLSATLRGLPVRERIRHGHLMAAAVLTVPGDLAPPASRAHADRLVGLDDAAWGRLRLGPGWTGDDQEVRTS